MIDDRDNLAGTPASEAVLACIEAGIDAVRPGRVVAGALSLEGDRLVVAGHDGRRTYDLDGYRRILLLGTGKGAARLASALSSVLGDRVDDGVIVTDDPVDVTGVAVVEAAHPVPDQGGIDGARCLEALAETADEDTLALVVITGGGSALLPAPVEGIDLAALQEVTAALVDSGAAIDEINAVRKHCSRLKGGGLAAALEPATVATLVVSDVVGDDPSVIASGPTAPDRTTYADALAAIDDHGVDAPDAVRSRLEAGERGDRPETPDPGDPVFDRVAVHVLATGGTALAAARDAAERLGYTTLVLSDRVRGEASELGRAHAAVAESVRESGAPVSPPAVVLSGGEATVTVTGDGQGGPNGEFALAAGVELADGPPLRAGSEWRSGDVAIAAVDTDGRDGPPGESEDPDPAGGLVDATTVDDPAAARAALRNDDSHTYLRERDALVITGLTGTNVNDLRVVVVESTGE